MCIEKHYRVLASLLMMFAMTGRANSQSSRQSLEELNGTPQGMSARAIALGNAYVSEFQDVNAIYTNPAVLAFLRTSSVVASFVLEPPSQLFRHDLAVPLRIGSAGSLAFSIQGSYLGERWTSPYAAFHSLDLGFAQKLTPTFSLGLLASTRYSTVSGLALWSGSARVGMFYFPSAGVSYGIAFSGMGWGTDFNVQDTTVDIEYRKNLPKSLAVGSSFSFPSSSQRPDFTMTVSGERIFGQNQSVYRGGVEVRLVGPLMVRCGLMNLPSGTVGTAGVGISIGVIQIDYSYSKNELHQWNHFLSLAYAVDSNFQ